MTEDTKNMRIKLTKNRKIILSIIGIILLGLSYIIEKINFLLLAPPCEKFYASGGGGMCDALPRSVDGIYYLITLAVIFLYLLGALLTILGITFLIAKFISQIFSKTFPKKEV